MTLFNSTPAHAHTGPGWPPGPGGPGGAGPGGGPGTGGLGGPGSGPGWPTGGPGGTGPSGGGAGGGGLGGGGPGGGGLPPAGPPAGPPPAGPPAGPPFINKIKLKQHTDELIDAISSPAFVAAMYAMKATPQAQRLAYAKANLTTTKLASQGVNFPAGMRVTSRYFEPGSPDVIEVTGTQANVVQGLPGGGIPGALGAWGCACGGAATVCGGAGGGS